MNDKHWIHIWMIKLLIIINMLQNDMDKFATNNMLLRIDSDNKSAIIYC